MDRFYLDYLPTLRTPQEIFRFDICDYCESIFLNPKSDDRAGYIRDVSKVRSYREHGLGEFRAAAASFMQMFPHETRVVVDAACGAGQALSVIKKINPSLRLVGLEISEPSVAFMNDELGIEAHLVDLDQDDLDPLLAPESVDFIILQEAFEHVARPVTVLKKMVRLLRPQGRMHFTAQYYGDNDLQIRVGEPIYINDVGLNYVISQIGAKVIDLKRDVKLRVTVEKPGGAEAGRAPAEASARPAAGYPDVKLVLPTPHRPWWKRAFSIIMRRTGLRAALKRR
jgi:SAM-dependent methyltransferase